MIKGSGTGYRAERSTYAVYQMPVRFSSTSTCRSKLFED